MRDICDIPEDVLQHKKYINPYYVPPPYNTTAPRKKVYRARAGLQCGPMMHYSEFKLKKTALASFMGSGNTWVRHLIQQLTGT